MKYYTSLSYMKWMILLVCLLVFVGCATTSGEYKPHVGREGLVMSFIPQAPPSQIYEDKSVSIGIDLLNKGAEDITNAKVFVGLDRGLFSPAATDLVHTVNLEGKVSTLGNLGERDDIFITTPVSRTLATEKVDTTVLVRACYEYKTVFAATICVDPDVLDEKTNKPRECQKGPSERLSFGSGQGAPVAVRSLEMVMIPSDENTVVPRVTFAIDKVDKSSIFGKEVILSDRGPCSAYGVEKSQIGLIDTSLIYLANTQLKCNTAQLRTSDAREDNPYYTSGTIVCEGDPIPTTEEAYLTSITMTLQYGVQTEIEKDFSVIKP